MQCATFAAENDGSATGRSRWTTLNSTNPPLPSLSSHLSATYCTQTNPRPLSATDLRKASLSSDGVTTQPARKYHTIPTENAEHHLPCQSEQVSFPAASPSNFSEEKAEQTHLMQHLPITKDPLRPSKTSMLVLSLSWSRLSI